MASGLEMVAGGFMSAIAERTVDKVVGFLGGNYHLPHAVENLLHRLQTSLTMARAVIEEASDKLITKRSLIQWLKYVYDAVYEAEDVLDGFDVQDTATGKRKFGDLLSSPLGTIKTLFLPDKAMERLEDVAQKLDRLCASVGTFIQLMKSNDLDAKKRPRVRETSSQIPADVTVFGRDGQVDLVLSKILSSGGVSALPIVGMSGVGKTTLAQVIFNHGRVKDRFEQRAWVYASEDFSMKRIMKEILRSFEGGGGGSMSDLIFDSLDNVINRLARAVALGRRFLLVLDDVWDEICDQWSMLLTALAHGAPGSVVLVTTQSQKVAKIVGDAVPVTLESVPWESFWQLFQHYAFGNAEIGEQERRTLELIGEGIARKLDGLPLAAKVIGNLLKSRLDEDEWRKISETDWWNVAEASDGILSHLCASYRRLNAGQRQCFAYCSIFPRNYLFEKDRLVQMWIAHDFIQTDSREAGTTRLEDLGRQWFDELVQRFFFRPTCDGDMYIMNNVIRGLATVVSSHECLCLAEKPRQVSTRIHHLSLQADRLDDFHELCNFKSLRTVLLLGPCDGESTYSVLDRLSDSAGSLRVLDLSHCGLQGNELPEGFRFFTRLRFLDLSCTRIETLRSSFCDLQHLQSLYLRGNSLVALPQGMHKLINLRHLHADSRTVSTMPGVGKLAKLQQLKNFHVRRQKGFRIAELKNMGEITGQLRIHHLEAVDSKEEAMEARLMEKKYLSTLVFSGRSIPKLILDGLRPPTNLKELRIDGYGASESPIWMVKNHGFMNLQSVHLSNCLLLQLLPPLGQLPSLKRLALEGLPSVKQVDDQFYGSSDVVFPSLNELKFSAMSGWEEWLGAEGRRLLPHLRKLHLVDCSALKKAPWLAFATSLSELVLTNCGDYVHDLPSCLEFLTSLLHFKISICRHEISLRLHYLKSLQTLSLEDCSELRLLDTPRSLVNLKMLGVTDCPRLFSQASSSETPHEHQELRFLVHLHTDYSLMLGNRCASMLGRLPSLKTMKISSYRFYGFSAEQEAWLQQLTSLQELEFSFCFTLERLPAALATLSSMKKLTLTSCSRIRALPETGMPPGLQELHLNGCSRELLQRCNREEHGADWPKIAHVPCIRITYPRII